MIESLKSGLEYAVERLLIIFLFYTNAQGTTGSSAIWTSSNCFLVQDKSRLMILSLPQFLTNRQKVWEEVRWAYQPFSEPRASTSQPTYLGCIEHRAASDWDEPFTLTY